MLLEGCSTEGQEGAVKAAPGLESLLITPNSENVDTVTKVADDETQPTLLIPPVSSRQYSSFEALLFNISSSILSPLFLIFCVLVPAILSAIPVLAWAIWSYVQFKDPNRWRPFYEEEKERRYMDTGKIVSDIGYYARRVGLDCEEFKIETEDGYILTMQHLIDKRPGAVPSNHKYPVLCLHGLLQASGTMCTNDDSSIAFFLCKSGYDVWLGNNRGYFKPQHRFLKPSQRKFWEWTLIDMAYYDLPAMIHHVKEQTGRPKIALVAHSQGTVLTFLALAKGQLPELGKSLSCVMALSPAMYHGTLLSKSAPFWFVHIMWRRVLHTFFGLHSFIALMLLMHSTMPGRIYGWLGYRVFNYLFGWSDRLWELRLRDRFFQFSPIYISTEAMRWWIGRDGFAKQNCVFRDTEEPWYDPEMMPPVSLFVGGSDKLVDGKKMIDRFAKIEKGVVMIRGQIDEEYEHLDCLWAMDSLERIGERVKGDIWSTTIEEDVVVPEGCRLGDKGRLLLGLEGPLSPLS